MSEKKMRWKPNVNALIRSTTPMKWNEKKKKNATTTTTTTTRNNRAQQLNNFDCSWCFSLSLSHSFLLLSFMYVNERWCDEQLSISKRDSFFFRRRRRHLLLQLHIFLIPFALVALIAHRYFRYVLLNSCKSMWLGLQSPPVSLALFDSPFMCEYICDMLLLMPLDEQQERMRNDIMFRQHKEIMTFKWYCFRFYALYMHVWVCVYIWYLVSRLYIEY